ncbi:retrovirus-related pol polyprotein from transposon TNT 1-94 [Tanacetum coccineum]
METIHVQFDELTEQMAPVQLSTRPAPAFLTPGHISSGLVPNPIPAAPYVPPTNKDLEILFQPMFDEYLEPPRVERPVSPAPAVQVPVNSTGTPSSTTIDQDAPSPKDNPFAPIDNDHFINMFAPEPRSEASSSGDLISTRKQLATDALWCLYNSVLSKVKPKNFKSAITEDCWFQAMQDEIHEFDRLQEKKGLSGWPWDIDQEEGIDFGEDHLHWCHLIEVEEESIWSIKKQKSTAISTTEAEYIAMSGCCALLLLDEITAYRLRLSASRIYSQWLLQTESGSNSISGILNARVYTMADINVNAPAEQAPAMAPPTRTDDQILPRIRWVPIGKSNCYLDVERSQSNPIYKIVVDILKHTNFFRAFPTGFFQQFITIYIQQFTFWDNVHQADRILLTKQAQVPPRPGSPLHFPNEEPILGYLKFSAKGTKREVFGMPIPNDLITDDIRGEQYYNAYLEKVAKHQRYLAGEEVSDPDSLAPKPAKATKPKASKQSKPLAPKARTKKPKPAPAKPLEKKQKLVTEISEAPSPAKQSKAGVPKNESRIGDEEADLQKAVEESLKEFHSGRQGPLPPVTPKKKSPADQFIFQRRTSTPTESSGYDESSSLYAELGLTDNETDSDEEVPGMVARVQAEGRAGPNPGEHDDGQAGPNPDDAAASQPPSSHVVHAGPNLEHMDLKASDTSIQPNLEQMDEEFTTTAYPNVQENLKLLTAGTLFTKLIDFTFRKHKFHPRPGSPLHLPNEEPVLGYLKFSAKGTKREVFGMLILNDLITDDFGLNFTKKKSMKKDFPEMLHVLRELIQLKSYNNVQKQVHQARFVYITMQSTRFPTRPGSPLHLPNEEPVLGYLKFSAKGTKQEVFGMPILNDLITDDIRSM